MGFKITKHTTGKLEGLSSLNTSSLSNPFCQKMAKTNAVCHKCYSNRYLKFRQHSDNCFSSNGEILSKKLLEIPFLNFKHFRFHSFGEVLNKAHAENFIEISRKNPHCTFSLWTKRKEFFTDICKPSNLILIYSNPVIDKAVTIVPKGFDKVFNVMTKENELINCGGKKCKDCLLCYSKKTTKVIYERLK